MPRFFFHIQDGVSYHDTEGSELPHWEAAQQEAMVVAGTMIADNGKKAKLGEDWSMSVTDEVGLVLFHLDFHVAMSPVLASLSESFDRSGT